MSSFSGSFAPGESVRVAGDMMTTLINTEGTLLPGFRLRVLWQDDGCDGGLADRILMDDLLASTYVEYPPLPHTDLNQDGRISFSETEDRLKVRDGAYVQPGPVGLMAGSCSGSTEPIIKWAWGLRLPIISSMNTRPDFSNRAEYPNYFRTVSHEGKLPAIIWRTVKMCGISRATVVVADTGSVAVIAAELVFQAQDQGITLVGPELDSVTSGLRGAQFAKNEWSLAIASINIVAKTRTRIVVSLLFPARTKTLLCAQLQQDLSSLIWFTYQYSPNLWTQPLEGRCSAEELLGVANGMFIAQTNVWGPERNQNMTCAQSMNAAQFQMQYYQSQRLSVGEDTAVPGGNYSLFLESAAAADSICMFALMLREFLVVQNRSLDELTGRTEEGYAEAVRLLGNSSFEGLRTFSYSGDADPDNSLLATFQLQAPSSPCMGLACGDPEHAKVLLFASHFGDTSFLLGGGLSLKFHFQDEQYLLPLNGGGSMNLTLKDFNPDCGVGLFYDPLIRSCRGCLDGQVMVAALEACRCRQGWFATNNGTCLPCPAGQYSENVHSATCFHCPAGEYAPSEGAAECEECPVGTYSDLVGATACTNCGQFQSTMRELEGYLWEYTKGSNSSVLCRCDVGTRNVQEHDARCVPCEEGLECAGVNDILVQRHFYSGIPLSVYRCTADSRCKGGRPGDTCSSGREGISCGECEVGKAPSSDGTCQPCSDGQRSIPVLFGLAVALVLVLIYFALRRPMILSNELINVTIYAGLLLTSTQVFTIAGSFKLAMIEPLTSVMEFLNVISLNFDLFEVTCIRSVAPVSRFLFQVGFVVMAALWLTLVHCVVILVLRSRNLRWYALKHVVGTIFLAFYISVVSLVLAPLECNEHPNHKQTMHLFPTIICWDSQEHQTLVIISVFAFLGIPVPLFARCTFVILQFPRRIRMGDSGFLKENGFLFFRFRPERHWYSLVILSRSLVCATLLVIPNGTAQALLLLFALTGSLTIGLLSLPWRTPTSNVMEVVMSSGLTVFATLTNVMAVTGDEGMDTVSYFATVVVCVSPLPFIISSTWLMYKRVYGNRYKRFQFFLCHHKAGAGAFTRLLKQQLLEIPAVKKEVFVDSDNLENLSLLFNLVATQMETLVIIASHDVFKRPWCVGEMTVTRQALLQAKIVCMPDMEMPSDDFMEQPDKYIGDLEVLVAEGIELQDIRETLSWVHDLDMFVVSTPLRHESLVDLVDCLCLHRPGSKFGQDVVDRQNSDGCEYACILCDQNNLEAVAAAHVLQKLILPNVMEMRSILPVVLSSLEEELPDQTTEVIILLSEGVFEQDWVLQMLVKSAMRELKALTVLLDDAFRFPSKADLDELRVHRGGEIAAVVAQALKEISVAFQPQHAPLKQLENGAREVSRRLSTREQLVCHSESHKKSSWSTKRARALRLADFIRGKEASKMTVSEGDNLRKSHMSQLSWAEAQESRQTIFNLDGPQRSRFSQLSQWSLAEIQASNNSPAARGVPRLTRLSWADAQDEAAAWDPEHVPVEMPSALDRLRARGGMAHLIKVDRL